MSATYKSFLQISEDVIVSIARGGDRATLRNTFAAHRDVYGRAWGLNRQDPEEVGFHGVIDAIRSIFGKEVLFTRGANDLPRAWSVV